MTPQPTSGTPSASTAGHLSELEARYDAHLSALRQHAAQLQAAVARDAEALAERTAPPAALDDEPLQFEPEPEPDPTRL